MNACDRYSGSVVKHTDEAGPAHEYQLRNCVSSSNLCHDTDIEGGILLLC